MSVYIFFLIFICAVQTALSMEDIKAQRIAQQQKAPINESGVWYLINDTNKDLNVRIRCGNYVNDLTRRYVHTDGTGMVNDDICRLPKQSYFTVDLSRLDRWWFPLRIRFFKAHVELVKDISIKGQATETCKNNEEATCFGTYVPDEKIFKKNYFPLYHIVKKKQSQLLSQKHFEIRKYEGDINELSIKQVIAGFKFLGLFEVGNYDCWERK
jgi:hypothetical protein